MPAVGLASYRYMLARISSAILGVYLGERTARRVLAGEVRRGTGRTIEAAILLADLRGFTSLAGREAPARVVAWLDEHLEAIGEAVAAHEGEVLKFLGDGLLAVFPVEEGTDDAEACRRALAAAERALAATDGLNARRLAAGEPELGLDLVLHYRRGGLRQRRRRPPPRLHRDRPDRQRGQPHRGALRRARAPPAAVRRLRRPLRPADGEPRPVHAARLHRRDRGPCMAG